MRNFLGPAEWTRARLRGWCAANKLSLLSVPLLLLASVSTAAEPDALIPVGDSPFALALSADGQQAVVVNLFPARNPDGTPGPNIRLLDLATGTELNAFQLGTRLVSVALVGTTALVVNEDQDVLRLVNVANGQEIVQIPVGSRPSNVVVTGPDTAIVTNGTSGDLSFVNLTTGTVVGIPVTVGNDPRSIALHPGGRFAYVLWGVRMRWLCSTWRVRMQRPCSTREPALLGSSAALRSGKIPWRYVLRQTVRAPWSPI